MNQQGTTDQQTGLDRLFAALRGIGIRRRTDDKWIAGVCSGLADRLGVDPVIVRAGLVLLSLLGGAGITIYLVAWALLPNDRDEIVVQRALRDSDVGAIILSVIATLAVFGGSLFGGPWLTDHSGWGFPWGLTLTGLLVWWLVKRSGNSPAADQRVNEQRVNEQRVNDQWVGAPPLGTPLPAPTPAQTQVLTQKQVAPRRLRRRSGGPLMALLAIGLVTATYASLIWAGSSLGWSGSHPAIAAAGSLGAIGLLMVALGLAGWRSGFVAFLAVILAVVALTSAAIPAGIHVDGRVGDATWSPPSVTTGTTSPAYHLGIGNGILDLSKLTRPTGVPSTTALPSTIPVSVGVGDLKVVVPAGMTVKVVGHVSLGEILFPTDTTGNHQGGSDISRSIVVGDGPTEVVVNAGVGIGQITVVKE